MSETVEVELDVRIESFAYRVKIDMPKAPTLAVGQWIHLTATEPTAPLRIESVGYNALPAIVRNSDAFPVIFGSTRLFFNPFTTYRLIGGCGGRMLVPGESLPIDSKHVVPCTCPQPLDAWHHVPPMNHGDEDLFKAIIAQDQTSEFWRTYKESGWRAAIEWAKASKAMSALGKSL